MHGVLDYSWRGNSVSTWLTALGLFIGTLVVLGAARWVIVRRLSAIAARTTNWGDDLVVDLARRTRWSFIVVVALAIALPTLAIDPAVQRVIHWVLVLGAMLQLLLWGNGVISFSVHQYRRSRQGDLTSVATIQGFALLIRIGLAGLVLILTLDLLGFQITTLIAGLGITGVAIALAVQNVLGDLFAAMSIVFDKPFVIGDFIVVDNFSGTVEHVGLKTTRVRSVDGEQIIIANADLLRSRIRNFRRLVERRVVLVYRAALDTPESTAARIPAMLREIVERQQPVRFDRAHLRGIGETALEFEVVYIVLTPDYNAHMDIQQAIHLAVLERFAAQGIALAAVYRAVATGPGARGQV
ncbi:MAG: mechanosensitive ion channel family protein [Gemmatimonadaceae bacterium]|nr:mechanosensitive ion channel family protein [Gemmatimonadaceae bacterium]NUQ94639.1 mechanosensitive ion channel family protein [Gemmatimonadaceae bacterium]NUR20742.1 mechanosensitive ion channel family protein [Gemmatimonadaceae bacterium]NUS96309.1 mechanosensitive ion channel family protein [Gemmatimonadaceae bacterium]